MSLRKIKLYGKLGKICGKEWELDVSSVGEAIKAININTNGKLEKYLTTDGALKYYKVCIKNKNNFISEKEINTPYENGDIYIIPVIRGAGKNGIFQAILGVVLIVVGYFTGTMGVLGRVGLALVFGGVAQLLMAPKISDNGEQRGSFLFQGNATAASQGGPVGIVYGRSIVAPMPICLSMDNLDKNSYEGEILQVGKLGLLLDTEILYSYRGGTASLCGFNEFIDPSTPPKKYLKRNFAGEMILKWANGCQYNCNYANGSGYIQISNSCIIDPITCNIISYGINNLLDCAGPATNEISDISNPGISTEILTKTSKEYIGNGCGSGCVCSHSCDGARIHTGSLSVVQSEEDTESNAINRLLNSISWSAWQSTPVYPFYYRNPASFSISYREVKTKTITTEKYNPGINYKLSYTIQRRTYGSSDPFVDAETIQTQQKPNNSGDFEIDIENQSGYESKITNITISL